MIERHLQKLRARHDISDEEEAVVRASVSEIRRYRPDETIAPSHTPLGVSNILVSGLACRAKDLADGRRQITELQTPGDYMDLHSFTLKQLDHEVIALTACDVAIIPHPRLLEITERHPHLTRIYWFGTNLDAAIHREWVLSLGRRSALESLAHLFCELYVRLDLVGLVLDSRYPLDITQAQLAECLGMTPVHVNRTLQQLRSEGLVEFRDGWVAVHNFARLSETAQFDPAYLYLKPRRR
ncbi:Crp/Fnr family transcriptional regulator [Brevundimonas lutea]|uniref:Crp/Fnr family transcriptional regulator n=1 Tax=Brevundimonas lutea TaxID=2293980 RepID=UPI000F02ADA4|nr:Crp/Fnr family transcriptional regulator [Brevundimonas lutea]